MLELSTKSETPEMPVIVITSLPHYHYIYIYTLTLSMFPTPQTHQDWQQASNPPTYELQPCNVNHQEKLPLGKGYPSCG